MGCAAGLCPIRGRLTEIRKPVLPDFERLLGRPAWLRLSAAIRARFSGGAHAAYAGRAQLQASLAGRVFAFAGIALGRPLPTIDGSAEARIALAPAADGICWMRHYRSMSGRWQTVRSVKRCDREGRLCECAGPVAMRLVVSEEKGALVFTSDRYFLTLGRLRVALPDWLTPGRIRVVHSDTAPGRFRFTLDCRHALFGQVFRQTADFADPTPIGET